MEELMIFLMSAEAINKAVQFISYDGASDMSHDQEKGLDGIFTDEDTKMMKYYVESLKYKVDHWSGSGIQSESNQRDKETTSKPWFYKLLMMTILDCKLYN